MSNLFSLQGKISTAIRNTVTGLPGPFTWLGNVSVANMALETDKSDKNESFSGNRLLYGSLQRSKSARVSMTLDELLPEGFALGLYGTQVDTAGANVADEVMPNPVAVGDQVQLDNPFVSAVVVTDSAASPATLIAGTDYVVHPIGGRIEILGLGAYTQPFHVAYTYAARNALVMFENVTPPERWVLFEGINTLTGRNVKIELYRMQFDPVSDFGLINDDFGGLQLEAQALYDPLNAADAALGGFGRYLQEAAA
jgi:hypothetical protein